jgi:hypothetical protein
LGMVKESCCADEAADEKDWWDREWVGRDLAFHDTK